MLLNIVQLDNCFLQNLVCFDVGSSSIWYTSNAYNINLQARGNYPRQEPSTVTQGTTASSGETESDGGTLPQSGRVREIGDTQTDKATGTSTVQIGSNVNMPSTSNKKSALPPLNSKISTVSELVPEGSGAVNAGFTDKPLPSIENRSPEIVLTPVTSLNLGVSIYS